MITERRVLSSICRLASAATMSITLAACQGASSGVDAAADAPSIVGPLQCSAPLPSGPPPAPEKLSAFGTATALNMGKSVGRSAITGAGTYIAGPVGGAVAGQVASRVLPSSYDIRGQWRVTDGSANCACQMTFTAPGSWTGANLPRGDVRSGGCNNALLASVNDWRLDETLSGLDAELLLYARNGNRIGVLKRNGPDHYSGQLSTGQQVTLWRE